MLSERLFEDILVKYPELIEENLTFIGRQVTYFGKRIDILFEDRFKEKLIVELKISNLQRNALSQVIEYVGYILSEKDPSARAMVIANRVPLSLKKAMDHYGIEYKEITQKQLLEFLEKRDEQLLQTIVEEKPVNPNVEEKPEGIQISTHFRGGVTIASKLDEIILAGGKWETIIAKAEAESQKLDGHIKYTIGVINAHIKYRTVTQKNPGYLKNLIVTEKGIFPGSASAKPNNQHLYATVTNINAKSSGKERFELWFNKSSEKDLPYGKTNSSEGIPLKIKIDEKIFSIGFHWTRTCCWLSTRLDRDGYNLTEILKSYGFQNRDKVLLTSIGNDTFQLTKL